MIPEWEALARLLLAVVLGAALFSVISRGDVLVALGEVDGVDEARWES